MHKSRLMFALLFSFFILSACQNSEQQMNQKEFPPYQPKQEDVVNTHGDLENKERFFKFINNVKNRNDDSIRVVNYTTEGDPIIQDLSYNGEVIDATLDSRRDAYGSGSLESIICQTIETEEKPTRTDYLLADCDQQNIDKLILVIEKQQRDQ